MDAQASVTVESQADGSPAPTARGLSYKPVGAVLAGLSVLRYLAQAKTPLPLSRITRDLKLNPSTCLNILRTLAAEDYVVFDPESKLYSMGLGVLELVGGAMAQGRDMRAIRSLTDQISMAEKVTVTLWRRLHHERIMLMLESLPGDNVSIKMNVGQRLPLLVGAAGRLMAAFTSLDDKGLAARFKQIRQDDPLDFKEFMTEVELTRGRGWAIDEGHYTSGTASVAVPVLDEQGETVFALTATMFQAQFSLERAATIAAELARPAALLSSALPYL